MDYETAKSIALNEQKEQTVIFYYNSRVRSFFWERIDEWGYIEHCGGGSSTLSEALERVQISRLRDPQRIMKDYKEWMNQNP